MTSPCFFACALSLQRELYKSILLRDPQAVMGSGGAMGGGGGAGTAPRLANLLMHLRKACAHPYLFEGQEDRSLDPMGEHVVANCAKLEVCGVYVVLRVFINLVVSEYVSYICTVCLRVRWDIVSMRYLLYTPVSIRSPCKALHSLLHILRVSRPACSCSTSCSRACVIEARVCCCFHSSRLVSVLR